MQEGCCVRILLVLITSRDTRRSTRRQRTLWHLGWNDYHLDQAMVAMATSSLKFLLGSKTLETKCIRTSFCIC